MKRTATTFTTADELYSRIDNFLPDGPKWYCKEVTLPEAPNEPQLLFCYNPVECPEFLSRSPAFDGHQDYSPVKHFTEKECTNCVYGRLIPQMHSTIIKARLDPKKLLILLSVAQINTCHQLFRGWKGSSSLYCKCTNSCRYPQPTKLKSLSASMLPTCL